MKLPPELEAKYQERVALEKALAESARKDRERILATGNRLERRKQRSLDRRNTTTRPYRTPEFVEFIEGVDQAKKDFDDGK